MSEFIIAGGPFMWPLLICSVLIISITIERLWFLQNRLVQPKGLTSQIINLFHKNMISEKQSIEIMQLSSCLLYTSPSPRDLSTSRMPSSA